jgi:hypothetical protein
METIVQIVVEHTFKLIPPWCSQSLMGPLYLFLSKLVSIVIIIENWKTSKIIFHALSNVQFDCCLIDLNGHWDREIDTFVFQYG